MNEKKMKQILDDLYKIDESFKAHEAELIKIISNVIELKPDFDIDENFVKKVRVELVNASKEGELEEKGPRFNLAYLLGGVAAVSAIFLLIFNYNFKNGELGKFEQKALEDGKIAKLNVYAFGDLIKTNQGAVSGEIAVPSSLSSVKRSSDAAVGFGGGGTAQSSDKMISMPAPDFVNFRYIYEGNAIGEIESSLPVYRRILSSGSSNITSGASDLNLLNIDKFQSPAIENINFYEDKEFGYNIYYNLKINEASISANYLKWPNPFADCKDDACYAEKRLTLDDVIPTDEAVGLADKFLEDYGVSKDGYGGGEIDNNWMTAYQMEKREGREGYVPDYITVVYPLEIEGKRVFDESGGKYGLRVEISNRYKKVSGVYGIKSNQFESSDYKIENNVEKLIKIAEQGGIYPSYNFPEATKQVDVKLGTPELKLISYFRYEETGGISEEFYIPALIFPIKEKPTEGFFYRESIVIPLAKEILQTRLGDIGVRPGIEPMPLIEPAATDTVIDNAQEEGNAGASGEEAPVMRKTELQLER